MEQKQGNKEQQQNQIQSKSPESIRKRKIFVGGLPSAISEEEFKKYFERFGNIIDVVVMQNSVTRKPRGFGFITFELEKSVDDVLEKNFHDLNGKQVEVKRVVPKEENRVNGKGISSESFPHYIPNNVLFPASVPFAWYNNNAYAANSYVNWNHMNGYRGNGSVPYDPYNNIWYVPMVSNIQPCQHFCAYCCPKHAYQLKC